MNKIATLNEIISFLSLTNPPLPYLISDTHHTMNELQIEASNHCSPYLLETLDDLHYEYNRKIVIYLNKLISYLKKKEYNIKEIETISCFKEYYDLKQELFMIICNNHSNLAWKTKKHFDEENDPMFNDDFLAGINTPKGIACFHFKLKYWHDFNIPEIEHGPIYDGYDSKEVLLRLASLINPLLVDKYIRERKK